VKYSELTRRLRWLGIRRIGEGKRHEIWARVDQQLRTVIPRHPAAEIPPGTLDRILKDLGLTRDDL
jgi:predicted RNA binding protein YcfA (HicA-like mRNA interferase family)